MKGTTFELVFNEDYNVIIEGVKYVMTSKPRQTKDGWVYTVELYEG